MAGPKGYVISFMMDVLAGVLTGSAFGDGVAGPYDPERRSGAGHLLLTIDVAAVSDPAEFTARIEALVDQTRGGELAAWADEILVPGELEDRNRRRLSVDGIPLADTTRDALATLAQRGAASPCPPRSPLATDRTGGPRMIALVVSLDVVPGRLEEFTAAIATNAERSFTDEPGCLYFDVVQEPRRRPPLRLLRAVRRRGRRRRAPRGPALRAVARGRRPLRRARAAR